ncbi:MAG: GNAT family N-acetyltransferase [Ignavibacteria bacterium]|nr:GNAT family N-acetyltransferase [Ignavibacteria bacterium]
MNKNNVQIFTLEDIPKEEIDKIKIFISRSSNSSIFHTIEWNMILSKVFDSKCQLGIIINDKKEITALILYHVFKKLKNITNIYSPPQMYEVPYGGFLFRDEKVNSSRELINIFFKHFISNYKNCACFITGTPGFVLNDLNSSCKVRNLKTPIVDLLPKEDEIFASFNSKRRNMIRKAEKNNIEIVFGGTELINEYYKMITSLYKKLNKSPLTIEYYSEILKTFYPVGMARVLLSKYKGEFLSGGIFLKYKNTGYYWHGASFENTPNLGQNELIQWEVMKQFKREGCTKYDLVRVEEEKLPNIALFKMGFTKKTEEFYDLYFTTVKNKVIRKIYSIFN